MRHKVVLWALLSSGVAAAARQGCGWYDMPTEKRPERPGGVLGLYYKGWDKVSYRPELMCCEARYHSLNQTMHARVNTLSMDLDAEQAKFAKAEEERERLIRESAHLEERLTSLSISMGAVKLELASMMEEKQTLSDGMAVLLAEKESLKSTLSNLNRLVRMRTEAARASAWDLLQSAHECLFYSLKHAHVPYMQTTESAASMWGKSKTWLASTWKTAAKKIFPDQPNNAEKTTTTSRSASFKKTSQPEKRSADSRGQCAVEGIAVNATRNETHPKTVDANMSDAPYKSFTEPPRNSKGNVEAAGNHSETRGHQQSTGPVLDDANKARRPPAAVPTTTCTDDEKKRLGPLLLAYANAYSKWSNDGTVAGALYLCGSRAHITKNPALNDRVCTHVKIGMALNLTGRAQALDIVHGCGIPVSGTSNGRSAGESGFGGGSAHQWDPVKDMFMWLEYWSKNERHMNRTEGVNVRTCLHRIQTESLRGVQDDVRREYEVDMDQPGVFVYETKRVELLKRVAGVCRAYGLMG